MDSESLFRSVGTKARLVDRVVNDIQGLIAGGQLEPGARLPAERNLAERIGVSRTVVREALHVLVTRGALETRQGVGTMVRPSVTDRIERGLNRVSENLERGVSAENLLQVRRLVDVEVAGLAAQHATQEELEGLARIAADMESAVETPEAFAARYASFHHALAQAAHNPLLAALSDWTQDYVPQVRALIARHPGLCRRAMPDHRIILERVAAGDVKGARLAMERHYESLGAETV